jgi:hypothetical protein
MTEGDARDLGLLLRFGLERGQRPTQNEAYRKLIDRLRRDPLFDQAFCAMLEPLGLTRLAADEYGLQLGVKGDSPFSMRLSDFAPPPGPGERMLAGLVLLAVAAYCFPRGADLDEIDGTIKRVTAPELGDYLLDLARRLEAQAERDPEADHPELREAFREVLTRAASKPTADGRAAPSTLLGPVSRILGALADAGMLREREGAYSTTRAFKVQLAELGANEAFKLVRRALGQEVA